MRKLLSLILLGFGLFVVGSAQAYYPCHHGGYDRRGWEHRDWDRHNGWDHRYDHRDWGYRDYDHHHYCGHGRHW